MAHSARVLPGPHHFAGMARIHIDRAFGVLIAECKAKGGALSLAQLEKAHTDIVGSLADRFDSIEDAHKRCMEASLAHALDVFTPETILASVLCAAIGEPTKDVFSFQLSTHGARWLRSFFACFANYVGKNVCPTATEQLMAAYRHAAIIYGADMTMKEFLSESSVRDIVYYCIKPLTVDQAIEHAADDMAKWMQFEIDGCVHKINAISAFNLLKRLHNGTPVVFNSAAAMAERRKKPQRVSR